MKDFKTFAQVINESSEIGFKSNDHFKKFGTVLPNIKALGDAVVASSAMGGLQASTVLISKLGKSPEYKQYATLFDKSNISKIVISDNWVTLEYDNTKSLTSDEKAELLSFVNPILSDFDCEMSTDGRNCIIISKRDYE